MNDKKISNIKSALKFLNRSLSPAVILLFVTACLFGQDRYYTNAFLEIPLGARANGMGGAYVSVANDGTAFFWNPAGVSLMHKRDLSMMYANQFSGFANYQFIGYTHKLSETYGFSVAWIRYSIGGIEENKRLLGNIYQRSQTDHDFSRYRLGRFDYADNAVFFSFARMNTLRLNIGWLYSDFPIQIPVGLNFKIISGGTSGLSGNNETVVTDARSFGVGADLGTMILFGMNDLLEQPYLGDFAIGLNIQDVTTTGIRWNSASKNSRDQNVRPQDVAKQNFKFGLSYIQPIDELESNILLSYESNSRYYTTKHWGAEFDYKRLVQFRLGYDQKYMTFGAGLRIARSQIDYAMVNHALGFTHRISASYKF